MLDADLLLHKRALELIQQPQLIDVQAREFVRPVAGALSGLTVGRLGLQVCTCCRGARDRAVNKHPDKPVLRITLPYHGRDLKRRTLTSIIDQSGLSIEEFLDLL